MLLLALLLLAPPVFAADASKPHPHQGTLEPYEDSPERPALTEEERATLAKGEPVLKQVKTGSSSGRGMAVQDVHAPPEAIWAQILDYAAYPSKVDNVYETEVYERSGAHTKVRFVIGGMGVKYEYFIDHVYRPDSGTMTWRLDYTRESDLDDSVGFWRVEPVPEKPGWSRVYYSVDVALRGWVPGFVESMVTKQGLTKATAWVKRESEKAAGN